MLLVYSGKGQSYEIICILCNRNARFSTQINAKPSSRIHPLLLNIFSPLLVPACSLPTPALLLTPASALLRACALSTVLMAQARNGLSSAAAHPRLSLLSLACSPLSPSSPPARRPPARRPGSPAGSRLPSAQPRLAPGWFPRSPGRPCPVIGRARPIPKPRRGSAPKKSGAPEGAPDLWVDILRRRPLPQ